MDMGDMQGIENQEDNENQAESWMTEKRAGAPDAVPDVGKCSHYIRRLRTEGAPARVTIIGRLKVLW